MYVITYVQAESIGFPLVKTFFCEGDYADVVQKAQRILSTRGCDIVNKDKVGGPNAEQWYCTINSALPVKVKATLSFRQVPGKVIVLGGAMPTVPMEKVCPTAGEGEV